MSKKYAELNEFIDEVSDGAYNLPCKEVILKRVEQLSCRHDRANFLFSWKTACFQEKEHHPGQDAGKHSEDRNQYQIADM